MTTAFETLYDLAISIRINPTHHKITKNHTLNRDLAENQLRRSILSLVMPGENINSRWEKLRIFCKNLANRAHSPLSFQEVSGLLSKVECLHSDESSRVLSIVDIANDGNGLIRRNKFEKNSLWINQLLGEHTFNEGSKFVNSAIEMIIENDRVNNEFYADSAID